MRPPLRSFTFTFEGGGCGELAAMFHISCWVGMGARNTLSIVLGRPVPVCAVTSGVGLGSWWWRRVASLLGAVDA
jgi:hypothetical protein